jgi:peroxiredoxin
MRKIAMRLPVSILLCAASVLAADLPRRAPGFALPDSQMKVFDLYDYRGKVVILELMWTACPHCASFASVLDKAYQKYGDKVQILAVVNSRQDNQDTIAKYAAGHKIAYPILFDAGQMAYSYMLVGLFDLPQVFLIDGSGMLRQHYEYGPMTRDIFEGNGLLAEVDRLLAASGSPPNSKKK